ncbi:MAG: hypothetical protein R6U98_25795 [Pirellulaceae bacterium]
MESGPTQAVLPLLGLAADKVIRHRYTSHRYTRMCDAECKLFHQKAIPKTIRDAKVLRFCYRL